MQTNVYLVIIGGNDGNVTPAANPWQTRIPNTTQIFSIDAIGIISVKTEHTAVDPPSTILVPNFSAREPPNI